MIFLQKSKKNGHFMIFLTNLKGFLAFIGLKKSFFRIFFIKYWPHAQGFHLLP